MEPFTITCSTCQSIIRIRNPKMIGQIANCPKCNSMIQIAEPRQIRVESHRGVIDSNAMTKEAFAPALEDEYRLAPSEGPGSSDEAGAAGLAAPPRVEAEPEFEDGFDSNPFASPPLTQREVPSQPSGSQPNAIKQLSVQRSARSRQVLMVAVLGSSGVLLAGLLFTGFLLWYRGDKAKPPIAKNPANINQNPVGPKREPETEPEPETEQAADPNGNTLGVDRAQGASGEIINEPNRKAGTDVGTQPDAPSTGNKTVGSDLAAAFADQNANDLTTPPKPTTSESDPTQPSFELPEQLKKFESIISTIIEPQLVPDEAVQKAPPTAEELGLAMGGDSRALPTVDVANQLELELSGLILPQSAPVSYAISTWVLISGIPTVVDLDSFAAAGIDPNKSISLKLSTAQPLAQVGQELAQQIGAEFRPINNQFAVFQATEEAMREKLPTAIKIDDLVIDGDQQQWLIKTLNHFSPQHTDKWTISDGVLTVDPSVVDMLTWFWTVRMLESWRHAAGLKSQLTQLDSAKFVTKFVDSDSLAVLDQPLSLNLLQRAPVSQLLSELCAAVKMHPWVDWSSVGQRGVGPNTMDVIVTQQRTLRQCLRDIVDKYGLVVACEDEQSLWITTASSYRAEPRIYVLPSQGKTAEQWIEELQPLTPATAEAVQPVRAILTPDSRFVIVRCCRPRIRT